MCSILFTTKQLSAPQITDANKLLKFRGPDNQCTSHTAMGTFIHNRLNIADNCMQPYNQDNIDLIFNGEIYNSNESNEAEFIIKLYRKHGAQFAQHLDGEYAIILVDNSKQVVVLVTDTFKTKPMWYSLHDGIHVSTYKSALLSCNVEEVHPVPPNSTYVYSLKTQKLDKYVNINFDLTQHKHSYDDWILAFKAAISKRTNTNKKIFIGLSSGYDSGCIACELNNIKKPFTVYSILNNENVDIINARAEILSADINLINYNAENNLSMISCFARYCEPDSYAESKYFEDTSSILLMYIGRCAQRNGLKIFLSGTGCDEIIGDYFIKDSYMGDDNSCFKGMFPDKLDSIFPWNNFFSGSMREYLTKDEFIIGSLGIEARYPFLDKNLVQEFLWLAPELKNKFYKAPLHEYLKQNNFPFRENEKKGFSF
jgi:asparagine synthetase B (glutamine-hydrolysing)